MAQEIDLVRMRVHAGMRQTEMARRLGLDSGNLSRLERGYRRVTIEMAEKYASECGWEIVAVPKGSDRLPVGHLNLRAQRVVRQIIDLAPRLTDDQIGTLEALLRHWTESSAE